MSDAAGVLRIPQISSRLLEPTGRRRERCPDSEWSKLMCHFLKKRGAFASHLGAVERQVLSFRLPPFSGTS
jgi:hypothetical protein